MTWLWTTLPLFIGRVTVVAVVVLIAGGLAGELWWRRGGPRVPPLPRSHPAVRPVRDQEGRR